MDSPLPYAMVGQTYSGLCALPHACCLSQKWEETALPRAALVTGLALGCALRTDFPSLDWRAGAAVGL